ncbi:4456_t:CDS:2 [Gigaspora margarita]|uniref:4456_t:CDS:1 n=1 Tax=Gigaspora margarita TaxID=4874 RepID=A0ABN7WIX2_GIGMA|nr:4456_t:CDS:2 [Gigaspora margarita]
MARARNNCTKHSTATRVFANTKHVKSTNFATDSNTSINAVFLTISTNPNMGPPQTPNILHAQIPRQMNNANGKAVASFATTNVISNMAACTNYASTNASIDFGKTTPSQTNNQFISYGPTQQLSWQQPLNVAMYNPWNNHQQQMSGPIDIQIHG